VIAGEWNSPLHNRYSKANEQKSRTKKTKNLKWLGRIKSHKKTNERVWGRASSGVKGQSPLRGVGQSPTVLKGVKND